MIWLKFSAERFDRDAEFLRRIQQKDEAALAELYDCYGGLLYTLILRMTGKPGAAEEVMQDTFLTVWNSASAWDPERGSVQAWLVTIARHRAIDFLRKQEQPSFPLQPTVASTDLGPDEVAVQSAMSAAVRDSVNELPDIYREVLSAVYFSGLSQREAADQLGIPLGTVKSRVRLALQRVARRLHLRGVVS